MPDLNPHVNQMADESMVRNLTAQIEAIWPQEELLYRRYGLAGDLRILDAGCGTGEASSRLAALYPRARVLGVDILDHTSTWRAHARRRSVLGSRSSTGASTSWGSTIARSTSSSAGTCCTRSPTRPVSSPSWRG